MHAVVHISKDDDGLVKPDGDKWHLVDPGNKQGDAALCTGEFFGVGESRCEYEVAYRAKGGITCLQCLEKLKEYKAVRL